MDREPIEPCGVILLAVVEVGVREREVDGVAVLRLGVGERQCREVLDRELRVARGAGLDEGFCSTSRLVTSS